MILREIKNMYIKNRLTEGVDFKRYEWLKGDAVAYINTNYLLDFDDIKTSIFRLYNTGNQVFEGSRYGTENNGAGTVIGYNRNNVYSSFFSPDGNMAMWDNNIPINVENTVIMSKNGITLNGNKIISKSATNIPIVGSRFESTTPYLIFASWIGIWQIDNRRQQVDYKSFEIEGKLHLTPCQLLKSIPSTLDANNRARNAGECGMYDSVSGKFFGNVASSGTFTVEGDVTPETHTGLQQIYQNKLIEGVDYETYDWLKTDIPINTKMMYLPISSKNFEFQRNWIQLMNSGYFETSGPNIYYINGYGVGDALKPKIWNGNSFSNTYVSPNVLGLGLHTIIANDNGVTISSVTNTDSLPWYGSPIRITFNNAGNLNKNTIHLTSPIKVDGVIRYVPCQLLRAIPRNLDAQCKERQAGECGMIDLISGKFYGNVANSGTFTVENDNNE